MEWETISSRFETRYQAKPERFFFANGRLEIIGNHTDHQGGKCLVGACSQGIYGAVNPKEGKIIRFASEGYSSFSLSLDDLEQKEEDKGTSLALVKGVLAGLKSRGYRIGAFDSYIQSDIYRGAGVSSSAAFELYVAEVENVLYNEGKIDPIVKAEIGQYAENVYFGKASGMLDQCGAAFGGIAYLDFATAVPTVESLPLPSWSLRLVLLNPGASHAGLNDLYSSIPSDMKEVAHAYGKERLSEVEPLAFYEKIHTLDVPSIAKTRALHFFGEQERVERAKQAILTQNLDWFLELEKAGQLSQMALLHNVMIGQQYELSPLEAAERISTFLKRGSVRVMGGGFAGSVICFIPEEEYIAFEKGVSQFYPRSSWMEVHVPPCGAHEVKR